MYEVFLKFLHARTYFHLFHKSTQNPKFINKKKLSYRMKGFQNHHRAIEIMFARAFSSYVIVASRTLQPEHQIKQTNNT